MLFYIIVLNNTIRMSIFIISGNNFIRLHLSDLIRLHINSFKYIIVIVIFYVYIGSQN